MIDTSKVYTSRNCGKFKIVNYIDSNYVRVKFILTKHEKVVRASAITTGCIKDPYYPSVYGVGFIGCGIYKASKHRTGSVAYTVWKAMLGRCYSKRVQSIHPTYKGCTVCDEWHNFQNFAKWYSRHHKDNLQIDKDIKIKQNTIYSPNTCLMVTRKENTVEAKAKLYVFISPSGVITKIYNMREFCNRNDLQPSNMSHVYSGKRKHHKGWRLSF